MDPVESSNIWHPARHDPMTWAKMRSHGVTEDTPLNVDLFFYVHSESQALRLAQELNEHPRVPSHSRCAGGHLQRPGGPLRPQGSMRHRSFSSREICASWEPATMRIRWLGRTDTKVTCSREIVVNSGS